MADAQSANKPAAAATETAPVTGEKAAIPLDYSVGGSGVDVEMEAPISTDDLIRAGGLGAGDGLNSVMPTSMDGSDLEESLIEAYEYEGREDDGVSRPLHSGLGATSQRS